MMVDVVLINPPCKRTPLVRDVFTACPHVGLSYIASNLEKNGFSVGIIDSSVDSMGVRGIIALIRKEDPKIIGVSVLTPTLPFVYDLVKGMRNYGMGAYIILGGTHVTADPSIVKNIGADFGLVGEADYVFVELCDCLINDKSYQGIPGLILDDKVNKSEKISRLDPLPFPTRHLYSIEKCGSTTVTFSRGCPFNCIFCSLASSGFRSRSADNVITEIKELITEYKVKSIDFTDDVFALDREEILNFCDLIKEEGLNFRWVCTTRVDLVDKVLLEEMYGVGCKFISFGVEGGVEKIRFMIGKKISDGVYKKTFDMCKEIGIKTRAYAMFGHPTETVEDMEKTISFVKELKPDYTVFTLTDIVPGSNLFYRALEEGIINENVWVDYMLRKRDYPIYIPKGMSKGDILQVYKKAFKLFYLRGNYFLQRIKSIESVNDIREIVGLMHMYLKSESPRV